MNIYDYLNSRDVREYWEKSGYNPNAIESAWLVWQSKNHTLPQKHRAWLDIIETTEDCPIGSGMYNIPRESLHKFLGRYMEIEKSLIEDFYKKEDDAVYTYRMYFDDKHSHDWFRESALFRTFEEAYQHSKGDGEPPYPDFVEFIKIYPGEKDSKIFLRFNPDEEIVRVDENRYITDKEEFENFVEVFENMWFAFPTPFKKGDIVEAVNGKYARPCCFADKFVLTYVCNESDKAEYYAEHGDGYDMLAYGYYFDRDGVVNYESLYYYMDLEYARTSLDGVDRLLVPLSKYLCDEIDLGLLLGAYRNILCDCEADTVRNSLCYTKEGMILAGIKFDK